MGGGIESVFAKSGWDMWGSRWNAGTAVQGPTGGFGRLVLGRHGDRSSIRQFELENVCTAFANSIGDNDRDCSFLWNMSGWRPQTRFHYGIRDPNVP